MMQNILSKTQLLNKMEMFPERFGFITCLKSPDRDVFIDEYIKVLNLDSSIQRKYYDEGVIKVSTWLNIMHTIEPDLENHYCVYRKSYYGENVGNKDVSSIKVSFKSQLVEFGCEHVCTVDLLIDDQRITKITAFRRSSFVNVKQGFWDAIIGNRKNCPYCRQTIKECMRII